MAYRRKQVISRASTFKEEVNYRPDDDNLPSNSTPPSMAAQAIRASAAHRDASSLSSAYGASAFNSSLNEKPKDFSTYEYTSLKDSKETKGFWGVLAQKAKSIIDDENDRQQLETSSGMSSSVRDASAGGQFYQPYGSLENSRKVDNPRLRKGLDKLTSSLNHIGGTIGNALEEGRTIVENKTADIIQETRKLQIRRKGSSPSEQNQVSAGTHNSLQQPSGQSMMPQMQTNRENQLKASRDVAMATAAKAKLLLRELKTAKADLAFAKERCAQLEEENKMLREAREKGDNPADDDMIRLQLETLLAEKARLAHENSVYSRENRFLREIVEYHQLTMQDVVYIDEGIEEVSEVYSPIPCVYPTSPQVSSSSNMKENATSVTTDDGPHNELPSILHSLLETEDLPRSTSPISIAEDAGRHSDASSN